MKKFFLSFATVGIMYFLASCGSSSPIDSFVDAVNAQDYEKATEILNDFEKNNDEMTKAFEEMSADEALQFLIVVQKYSNEVKTPESNSLVVSSLGLYAKKAQDAGEDMNSIIEKVKKEKEKEIGKES